MLFSATLTEEVLRLASQWAPDPIFCEVEPERVTVDTVKQVVYVTTARDKFKVLYNLLAGKTMERVLNNRTLRPRRLLQSSQPNSQRRLSLLKLRQEPTVKTSGIPASLLLTGKRLKHSSAMSSS